MSLQVLAAVKLLRRQLLELEALSAGTPTRGDTRPEFNITFWVDSRRGGGRVGCHIQIHIINMSMG
jgi:hypothetical protein